MPGRLASWFRPFEGDRDPYPIAIVRIALFAGLVLHFAPSLIWLDIGYGRGAIRVDSWNHWLYSHLWKLPPGVLRAMAIVTLLGCVAGLVGLRPRIAAVVAGIGCYTFASFNAIHVQTLALIPAWAMLTLWIICGGGSAVLSIDARLGKPPAREDSLLGSLILFQVLLAVFFSGIEKLLAGWPWSNEMGIVLAYPKGFIVRDWVAALPFLHGPVVSNALTWLTLLVELGTPILLLVRRTRLIALAVYELFFLGIIAMLEVPPLFYVIFASVPLLALDDEQLATVRRVACLRRRARP
ncbi:MAG TPA: hypothetical protein VFS15_20855 [Kofleriaceae bacterium]|nr:hypothetical protein [Kofleriaceae bacterium]